MKDHVFRFVLRLLSTVSVLYMGLIFYDLNKMLVKDWSHGELIFLQSSTVCSVLGVLITALILSSSTNGINKKVYLVINGLVLVTWVILLMSKTIGVI